MKRLNNKILRRKFVKEAARINAEQDEITVGITFFADLTEEEKRMYHGANLTEQVGCHGNRRSNF